jgi:hypothetical protein
MNEKQLLCPHLNFSARVEVNRIEDTGRFMADISISCSDCGLPFSFKGLPQGLDVEGATVSPGGTEGRFALAPGELAIETTQVFRV